MIRGTRASEHISVSEAVVRRRAARVAFDGHLEAPYGPPHVQRMSSPSRDKLEAPRRF